MNTAWISGIFPKSVKGAVIPFVAMVILVGIFMLIPLEMRLFFIVFGLVPLLVIAVLAYGIYQKNIGTKPTSTEQKRGIVFQVPKNHYWILRNVWNSSPTPVAVNGKTEKQYLGYTAKGEGYRFYFPKFWHSDEGLVNLVPVQMDLDPLIINCTDGNDVAIDTRITYFVKSNPQSAIAYLLNTANVNCDKLVSQRVKAALNVAMKEKSKEAIEWKDVEKRAFGATVTNEVNIMLSKDADKDYGIEVKVDIQNVEPTPGVKAAADRKMAAEIELQAADNEAAAMKTKIRETGANPTVVLVAETIADSLRSAFKVKGAKK